MGSRRKQIRTLLRGDKKFWSPVAITSGISIIFFGITFVVINQIIGWIDIVFGLALLVVGFLIAPIRVTGESIREDIPSHATQTTPPAGPDIDKDVYLSDRKSLIDALQDQLRSFDKYILTLSAGTFGLSLLFINQIAPNPRPDTLFLLIGAWCAFGISILSTLVSFQLSRKACLKQIDIIEAIMRGDLGNNNNIYTKVTNVLNWLSMFLFLLGIALLLIFCAQNLIYVGGKYHYGR